MKLKEVLNAEFQKMQQDAEAALKKSRDWEVKSAKTLLQTLFKIEADTVELVDAGVRMRSGEVEMLYIYPDALRKLRESLEDPTGLFFVFPCVQCGEEVRVHGGYEKVSIVQIYANASQHAVYCDTCLNASNSRGSLLIAQLPDGEWVRDNNNEITNPHTIAAILAATIPGDVPVDPNWDGIPYDAEASAALGFGEAGVGAVCGCPEDAYEEEAEPFKTIAEAIDILRPGRYPVYGMRGQVLTEFDVPNDNI